MTFISIFFETFIVELSSEFQPRTSLICCIIAETNYPRQADIHQRLTFLCNRRLKFVQGLPPCPLSTLSTSLWCITIIIHQRVRRVRPTTPKENSRPSDIHNFIALTHLATGIKRKWERMAGGGKTLLSSCTNVFIFHLLFILQQLKWNATRPLLRRCRGGDFEQFHSVSLYPQLSPSFSTYPLPTSSSESELKENAIN